MLAAFYQRKGAADDVLTVAEQPTPVPAAGEVRVRLFASGVNPSDVKMRAGVGAVSAAMPFPLVIPHSDGAGVIDEVGEGVSPQRCGEKVYTYNAGWKRAFGTAAEYVVLPEAQAVALPAGVDFAHGACLGIPAMTAYHTVTRARRLKDATVLVSGGGGNVGRYAIQIAKALGAGCVIATAGNDRSRAAAQAAGADHVIDYRQDDLAAQLGAVAADGVDHAIECEFGENAATLAAVLNINGTVAAYGSAKNMTPTVPFYEFMFKDITLYTVLVYCLHPDDRAAAIDGLRRLLAADALSANIAARFPLTDIAAAHRLVEDGDKSGAVIVTIADSAD